MLSQLPVRDIFELEERAIIVTRALLENNGPLSADEIIKRGIETNDQIPQHAYKRAIWHLVNSGEADYTNNWQVVALS